MCVCQCTFIPQIVILHHNLLPKGYHQPRGKYKFRLDIILGIIRFYVGNLPWHGDIYNLSDNVYTSTLYIINNMIRVRPEMGHTRHTS